MNEERQTSNDEAHRDINTYVSLAQKINRTSQLMSRYARNCSSSGRCATTPLRGQGRVLALLEQTPKTTQKDLSSALLMRQQSLSELLRKLEEKGYIARTRSEDDARIACIELTEEGHKAASQLNGVREKIYDFQCLDDFELAQFNSYLERIVDSLEKSLIDVGDEHIMMQRKHRCGMGHGMGQRQGMQSRAARRQACDALQACDDGLQKPVRVADESCLRANRRHPNGRGPINVEID